MQISGWPPWERLCVECLKNELVNFGESRLSVTDASHCDPLTSCLSLRAQVMQIGQKVRVSAVRLARDWSIPRGSEGTVVCSYRLLKERDATAIERLDVRFSSRLVVWGAPAKAFEPIVHR